MGGADPADGTGAILFVSSEPPSGMEAWLDAVDAADDYTVVACLETDGCAPVATLDDERARGRFQLRLIGTPAMRADFRLVVWLE